MNEQNQTNQNEYQNLYDPNYQGILNAPPQAVPVQPKPEVHYSKTEQICAFLAMLAGFLFIRFTLYHETGIFTTLFFWFLITVEVIFVKSSGKTFTKSEKFVIITMYLFSCAYFITANETMKILTTLFLILDSGIFLLGVSSSLNTVLRFLPEALPLSALAMPLSEFGKCFDAVKQSKGNTAWKNAGYILGGLLIALPLTCIVASLLCQADDNMSSLLGNFLKIPPEDLLILVPQLLFGVLIGCGIFSAMFSATHKTILLDEETCEKKAEGCRFIPNVMLYTAVTPICVLYVLYFISQMQYFTGGFTGTLAEGFTYAEYARKGFFELCWICVINLAVIGAIGFFARMTGSVKPLMLKIYSAFLCFCSLFLAGTAIAKMFLYIRYYGMTRLRVYTTWFMFLLVIGFMVLIVRQFRYSLNIGKIAYITFTVMFGILVFSRPDEWITRYNANQYLAGNLKEFDTSVIHKMSDDAWAGLSFYSTDELTRLYNADSMDITEVMKNTKQGIQNDFYDTLNLSAWELICNVK
ncbi:MAG: DUF4173 domain-containing protein [Ruminococcus sp.]|nr:DUF4173 domain-containing protein [Ruminococcus sp.]